MDSKDQIMIQQRIAENRIDAIDWMKGLCIICITLLHIENGIFPNKLNISIGMFMITGFYVTSGWVHGMKAANKTVLKVFIQKRWKSLGVPYLWFTGILILVDFLFYLVGHYEFDIVLRDIYKSIVLRGIGTLWFLPVLFGGELLFVTFRNKRCTYVGLLVGLITFILLSMFQKHLQQHLSDFNFTLIKMPLLVLSSSASAWTIITASYLVSRYVNQYSVKKKYLLGCAVLLLLTTLVYLNTPIDENLPSALLICIAKLFSFIEPLAILFLFLCIAKENILLKYLQYWGKNSIILMAVHYSILMELFIWIVNIIWGVPLQGWNSLICFFIIMALQYPIAEYINCKLEFLIGK